MRIIKPILKELWLLIALLATISCSTSEEYKPQTHQPRYNYFTFGSEEIPVESILISEDDSHLIVKISPLEEVLTATTYAIIGVHKELLGKDIDVSLRYHNDDYIFAYEDPIYYYSPTLRPLQEGRILMDRNAAGTVRLEVDVKLYDGTPFSYRHLGLRLAE